MIMEVYEKDGRLWVCETDGSGRFVNGPTNVQIVKDDAIDAFLELVSRPEVEKAMLDCKKTQDEKRATSNSGA